MVTAYGFAGSARVGVDREPAIVGRVASATELAVAATLTCSPRCRSRMPVGLRRLRRVEAQATLIRVDALDIQSVLAVVEAERERTARQIAALEAIVAAIVEGSELISTDDEHDPEGATIAYERAQASALLRQARADCDALLITRRQLGEGRQVICSVCGREIDLERVAALPTTTRCVHCAA